MLNSTKIEDVVEVRIELGKTFVRENFVFLGDSFFCSTKGVDGLVLKSMITQFSDKLLLEVKLGVLIDF